MRLLLLPLVLLAVSGSPIQAPMPLPLPAPTVAASSPADIDAVADDLHRQAVGALERLRQSRERRLAMAEPATL